MVRDPVQGGEQFYAIGRLETFDQIYDLLQALPRFWLIRKEGCCRLNSAWQQLDLGIRFLVIAITTDEVALHHSTTSSTLFRFAA